MTTRSLVENASFSISCDFPDIFVTEGLDGKCYGKYGIGLPLLSIPLYLIGRFLSESSPSDPNELSIPKLTVSMFNQFVTAATCSILYILGFRITRNKKRSVELAFAFGLLTIAWPYANSYFSQPTIGFLLLLSIVLIGSPKRSLISNLSAGAALGIALLVRLDTLPLILTIYVWAIYTIKINSGGFNKGFITSITIISIPIASFFAIFAIIHLNHYESLFQTGYEGEGWNSPFFTGFLGLLVSFGKGVVFYSPLIVLALPGLYKLYKQTIKDLPLLAFALFIAQLLTYSSWWSWIGGWSWGPRFLVPSLPLLMIGLIPWLEDKGRSIFANVALPFLILVSFLVQLVGATTDPLQYFLNYADTGREFLYNPAVSPILIQFQDLILRKVSLLLPSNGHGVLTKTETIIWAFTMLLLLLLSGRELIRLFPKIKHPFWTK